MLTLRKRPSGATRRGRSRDFSLSGLSTAPQSAVDTTVGNPWEDAAARPRNARTGSGSGGGYLNHRLSFDVASGVIMLPDDGDWLVEDTDSDDDDDDDMGEGEDENGGLERSVTETVVGEDALDAAGTVSTPLTPTNSRASRYGTYFHHPERRRQVVPGAFPRSG